MLVFKLSVSLCKLFSLLVLVRRP